METPSMSVHYIIELGYRDNLYVLPQTKNNQKLNFACFRIMTNIKRKSILQK